MTSSRLKTRFVRPTNRDGHIVEVARPSRGGNQFDLHCVWLVCNLLPPQVNNFINFNTLPPNRRPQYSFSQQAALPSQIGSRDGLHCDCGRGRRGGNQFRPSSSDEWRLPVFKVASRRGRQASESGHEYHGLSLFTSALDTKSLDIESLLLVLFDGRPRCGSFQRHHDRPYPFWLNWP